MQSTIRDEVGLYWLYSKFDEHAGLIPFPEEACKVLRRLIDVKEIHSFTFSPATSARRLVEYWLDTGRLPMRHRGKVIAEQLSGVPAGDDLSDYVDLNKSLDGQTNIRCSDLIRLMLAEGMTVPAFLLLDDRMRLIATRPSGEYERAWELWDERDLWLNMDHQNDPFKFREIRAELARIDNELNNVLPPESGVLQKSSFGMQAQAKQVPKNAWDEHALQRLLAESMLPGMTHEKLGEKYNVTRQRIGSLLKRAAPKKADPFSALSSRKPKK